MIQTGVSFALKTIRFDEHYRPAEHTRITTNFANLARGPHRQDNLRRALRMMDSRFNALAAWDNPLGDRYALTIDIVSVEMSLEPAGETAPLPIIEILKTEIFDQVTGRRMPGMVGNNFSSYVRDYDFNVLLPRYGNDPAGPRVPADFGALHGRIFQAFLRSDAYRRHFAKPPVICLSVSSSRDYRRTDNAHPILGVEYRQEEPSLTDRYFGQMGLRVRYFMPAHSAAPFAFYFMGDLLNDYTNLELVSAISVMDTFQKIYRPEIYNANAAAGRHYRPSLQHQDYSLTQIVYDREERSRLGVEQGKFVEEHFIRPHGAVLERWCAEAVV